MISSIGQLGLPHRKVLVLKNMESHGFCGLYLVCPCSSQMDHIAHVDRSCPWRVSLPTAILKGNKETPSKRRLLVCALSIRYHVSLDAGNSSKMVNPSRSLKWVLLFTFNPQPKRDSHPVCSQKTRPQPVPNRPNTPVVRHEKRAAVGLLHLLHCLRRLSNDQIHHRQLEHQDLSRDLCRLQMATSTHRPKDARGKHRESTRGKTP